jgi:DNA polymerase III subunit alpha
MRLSPIPPRSTKPPPPPRSPCSAAAGADIPEPRLPFRDDWLPVERLAQEHQAIGFYLSGHPLDDYMSALKRRRRRNPGRGHRPRRTRPLYRQARRLRLRPAGTQIRQGQPLRLRLSSPTRPGFTRSPSSPTVLEASRDYLEPGRNVVLTVKAELEGETLKLLANVRPAHRRRRRSGRGARHPHPPCNRARSRSPRWPPSSGQGRRPQPRPHHPVHPRPRARDRHHPAAAPTPITPQIKGAIKAMQGVVAVEDL